MDKLWYQKYYRGTELERQQVAARRQYIQRYIDLYCPELFSVPEDITTDNLKEFLEIILKYYQLYLFNLNELINLGESLTGYLHRAYMEDFPDTLYPRYPDSDRRGLALCILNEMDSCQSILPEDVPFLIKCLNVPNGEVAGAYKAMKEYFEQLDCDMLRFKGARPRYDFLNKQRLEAIEKGRPLPIRPMGIELDMCYKK